jgi:hypothetical protein
MGKFKHPREFFFSKDQIKILSECRLANSEDNYQWMTKNVVIPIVIVLMPLIIQAFFSTQVTDYKTLIFNGSISLLGVNILFGMSTYLIKVNRIEKREKGEIDNLNTDEEKKLNQDVIDLRSRLDDYKNILVVVGSVFYIVQALWKYNSNIHFYIFLLFTVLILTLSVIIGRYMFIIKDDFFEKTFYGELNEPVIQARARWAEKY